MKTTIKTLQTIGLAFALAITMSVWAGGTAFADDMTLSGTNAAPAKCRVITSENDATGGERTDAQLAQAMEECPAGSGRYCPVGTSCYCDSQGCLCSRNAPW
ncbi:MAG: hypothetical protein KDJ16_02575 [Hyphomicrobiales bacterium]|nr:hypothetical protein [Hyphomicrobiales bacterium]